jgi:uncharacterized glyoxalase superfamily protein PhnB
MKVSPYLIFNGNCVEAIKLYEKAFNTKANYCQYKDAPPSENYPIQPGTEEFVMHAVLPIGNSTIYLCDTTPDNKTAFGNGSFACVELDNAEHVKAAFNILKVGGKVFCEAQETFWNKCYAEFEDKFGLKWTIMIEEIEKQFCQSCGMPLETDELISQNKDYCVYCYTDGAFTQNVTMDEMIEISLKHMKEMFKDDPNFNEKDALDNMKVFFPKLKRWTCNCSDECASGYNPNCTCTYSECQCREMPKAKLE